MKSYIKLEFLSIKNNLGGSARESRVYNKRSYVLWARHWTKQRFDLTDWCYQYTLVSVSKVYLRDDVSSDVIQIQYRNETGRDESESQIVVSGLTGCNRYVT